MPVQQIEAAAQAAQHAQPEDIDLEDADATNRIVAEVAPTRKLIEAASSMALS